MYNPHLFSLREHICFILTNLLVVLDNFKEKLGVNSLEHFRKAEGRL